MTWSLKIALGSAQSPMFLGVGALTGSIPQCSASVQIRCRNGCLDILPANTIHRSLFLRPRGPKALASGSEAESHITDLRVLFLTLETGVLETSLSHLTHVRCSSIKWTRVQFKGLCEVGNLMQKESFVDNKNYYNIPFWMILENEVYTIRPPLLSVC